MLISKRNAEGNLAGVFRNGKIPGVSGRFRSLPVTVGDFTYRHVVTDDLSGLQSWEQITEQVGPDVQEDGTERLSYKIEYLSLADAKAQLADRLAARRFQIETAGLRFKPSTGPSVRISTDRDSQTGIWGLGFRASKLDSGQALNWKHRDGFVRLTKDDALRLVAEVGDHIQKAFDEEAIALARIKQVKTLQALISVSKSLKAGASDK